MSRILLFGALAPLLAPYPACADDQSDIVVTAAPDAPSQVAGRNGLTPAETPATIDIVTQEAMQAKGLRTAVEVYDSVPGVVAGLLPGEPASASIRGFSTGAVSYLFDGMRMADSTILSRNYDAFNFARIEVLKGPASILYGDGALAGTINLVPKTPAFDATHVDMLASYGSFNSARIGAGVNQPLSRTLALRTDLSVARSDGYVDDTRTRTIQSTSSLAWRPTERLSVVAAFDWFQDRARTAYQGTPLVPGRVARDPSDVVSAPDGYVLDRAMRDANYNVTDGRMESDSYRGRLRARYELGGGWALTDEASLYRGDRLWAGSEDYTFNAGSGLLDRTTTKIVHDHDSWSNRAWLNGDVTIAGMRHRLNLGAEYNATNFATQRRFGTTTPVDPFAPVRGRFPADDAANFPGAGNRADFTSRVTSWALFADDAVTVTKNWIVLGGLRLDRIDLDRRIDDLNTGGRQAFGRRFSALSGRLGTVYSAGPTTQLYAQYSRAVAPVGALLLSNVLRARVDLTTGDSLEGGVRTGLFGERMTLTAAGYWIRQRGILTRDPAQPGVQVQGGVQSSRGVELSLAGKITPHLSFDANGALLKARFDALLGAGGVDLSGNRPVNVPQRLANLSLTWAVPDTPLSASGSLRHVGDLYTSTANDIRVAGYTILDAALGYRLPWGTVTVRGRNLANRFYAYWSGYGANQVYAGAPRSVDVTLAAQF